MTSNIGNSKYKNKPKNAIYKNKDWLYNIYIINKKSSVEIAKICNVYHSTVLRQLKKYNIKRRNISYSIHIKLNKNKVDLSKQAKQFIYGELLGDGHLTEGSRYACLFSYASKYKKYLEWLSSQLNNYGIKQSGKIYKRNIKGKNYYQYFSKSYPEFKKIRKIFYPNNIKIIPNKINITPLLLRQWYIGDGSLIKVKKRNKGNEKPYIRIATLGYNKEDLEIIIIKLCKLNLKCNLNKDKVIRFSVYSTNDFLDYIGICPIDCYKYKWR